MAETDSPARTEDGYRCVRQHRDRSPLETDELIHRAHASRWHWGRVGEAVNLARCDWKVRAAEALDGVADQDDREPIERDLATLPV